MGNFHGVQISFFSFFMMGMFSCVKWTVLHRKITHTNQLEIAQNEIWTPRKFLATRYFNSKQFGGCGVVYFFQLIHH